MSTVIRAYGPVSGVPPYPINGEYLKSYDPEAFDGRGDVVFTANIAEAMRFDSYMAAMAFARRVPACRPLRGDGKPNMPLTAFTLEILRGD